MKKIISVFATFFIIVVVIIICALNKNKIEDSKDKITVITSLFPQYDFVKQIGKDKVDVQVLLPAGTESHTYEPTPSDIININKANLFCYTSRVMEPYAQKIASSIDSDTMILEAGENVGLIKVDHDEGEEYDEHHHEFDPHIWLDPQNAIVMVENITEALCKISPSDEEFFRKNSKEYIEELEKLDEDIEKTVNNSKHKRLIFGGEFAYIYFLDRYDINYVTVYDGCGEGAEPSAQKIKGVIDIMNNEESSIIFYEELSEGKIANMIAKETGAEAQIFHTLHNVSNEELRNGVTYISLMRDNLEKVNKALN